MGDGDGEEKGCRGVSELSFSRNRGLGYIDQLKRELATLLPAVTDALSVAVERAKITVIG